MRPSRRHGAGPRLGAMNEPLSEEELTAEAAVVASRIVEWFRQRLLAADDQRLQSEKDRKFSDEARLEADDRRRDADVARQRADDRRVEAERRVIEVEALLAASQELAEQLQRALDSRILIEQAKGMLAARHGATLDAAFEAMRSYARSHRRSVRAVAADVIGGSDVQP